MTPHTDDPALLGPIREATFSAPIETVRASGMAALADLETGFFRFADQLNRFTRKRETLLRTDPERFISAMKRWSRMMTDPAKAFMANLEDADLAKFLVPTLVLPRLNPHDDLHPVHTAEILARKLPNSTTQDWNAYFGEHLPKVRADLESRGGGDETVVVMASAINDFLRAAL
jgi:hypothetical protein